MEVLIEEVNDSAEAPDAANPPKVPMVTGRLSNNTVVHVPGDASLIGKVVKVCLDECHGFYYIGHCV